MLPVTSVKLPTALVGVANGNVPSSLLAPCGVFNYYSPSKELALLSPAARSMRAMVAAMKAALKLDKVTATETLRTYATQLEMFDGTLPASRNATNGRYVPQAGWSAYEGSGGKWYVNPSTKKNDVRSWNGRLWKRRIGTAASATPGSSNHGLALAIDFALVGQMVTWLTNNASRYGWSAEDQEEPWHWRYFAGDSLPAAVIAYETSIGQPPTPTIPTPTAPGPVPPIFKDIDMNSPKVIDWAPGTSSWVRLFLNENGHIEWLENKDGTSAALVFGPPANLPYPTGNPTNWDGQEALLWALKRFKTVGRSPWDINNAGSVPQADLDAVFKANRVG